MPDPRCEGVPFLTCPRLGEIVFIVLFAWGLCLRLPECTDVAGSFLPNLLNTPPSFRSQSRSEGALSVLSVLKTLACGDGLWEWLSSYFLLCSVRAVGVLDSEYCDSLRFLILVPDSSP
ncbi:hypothetical protein Tco_1290910 [Tanacetum coccineum]